MRIINMHQMKKKKKVKLSFYRSSFQCRKANVEAESQVGFEWEKTFSRETREGEHEKGTIQKENTVATHPVMFYGLFD